MPKRLREYDPRRSTGFAFARRAADEDHRHRPEAPVDLCDSGWAGPFDQPNIGCNQRRPVCRSGSYGIRLRHGYIEGRRPFVLQHHLDVHRGEGFVLDDKHVTHTLILY
jgi:hypothetical protein